MADLYRQILRNEGIRKKLPCYSSRTIRKNKLRMRFKARYIEALFEAQEKVELLLEIINERSS